MLPVIAIVGRPNVGKSTLFNRLTRSRHALVADQSGLTRDRQYGQATACEKTFIVIDTGGIGEEENILDEKVTAQSHQAMREATSILVIFDGREGLTPGDQQIIALCRRLQKPVYVAVNKMDGLNADVALAEYHKIGFPLFPISAEHQHGLLQLFTAITNDFPEDSDENPVEPDARGITFAIIGRPNAGKSTLTNRLLGEERMITSDIPGTTRDSIYITYDHHGKPYTVIDTAGVRRRGKVHVTIEKFSVVKTLQAISDADVVIVLIDATQEIANQDLHLIGYTMDAGKAMVLAINKWDGLEIDQRDFIRRELERKLAFIDFAESHFISALHGTGVGVLYKSIDRAYDSATRDLPTPLLTKLLEKAQIQHQPPLVRGRRLKMRYAHAGGKRPPVIVIHGNQLDSMPLTYQRYLMNYFREKLDLVGTPIRLQLQTSDNPFKDRRNTLTPRQLYQKRRLMRHVKK